MALPDLATSADLSARGVEPDDDDVAAVFLTVASSVIRSAAQSPIVEATSTVELWALDAGQYLDLPGRPITAVSAVAVDGSAVADFSLIHGRLWRRCGWASEWQPKAVAVTMTHGLPETPAWVVQLVCDLAIAGITAAPDGARDPRVITESIDDYSVTFSQQAGAVATAMELPAATKQALRKAFGGGVGMVSFR